MPTLAWACPQSKFSPYRLEQIGVNFHGGRLAQHVHLKNQLGLILLSQQNTLRSLQGTGNHATAIPFLQVRMWIQPGALTQGKVNLDEFMDQLRLIHHFNDLGNPVAGQGQISAVPVTVEKHIAAE